MSKFFEALEQARRERALAGPPEKGDATTPAGSRPAAPPATPARAPAAAPRDGAEDHLVSLLAPASFEAEQYRALRHLVESLHKSAGLTVIGVSSPGVGDGKTLTAINLAGALAQAPQARVLLVDADLRRSAVAGDLGLGSSEGPGFVDAILDPSLGLADVTEPRPPFNLDVVPAGHRPATPYETLKAPRLGELLEEARRRYDYVVLDTPPLVPVPDCRVLGKWVDGFLVVVTAHRTPRKLLAEALHLMDPAKVVGLVFNADDQPISAGYYRAYGAGRNGNGRPPWWDALGRARRAGRAAGRVGR